MSYRLVTAIIIMITAVFLMACSPRQASSPKVQPVEKTAQEKTAPSKEPWEMDWEKTRQAARKEGTVVIHAATIGGTLRQATSLLKSKFGIDMEISSKRGAEISATIRAERNAGIYNADVVVTGLNTFFNQIEPAGWAEPLDNVVILPENVDPKNWYRNTFPWGNEQHSVIKMYARPGNLLEVNTNVVKEGEIKSYSDLLEPKWKGKIVMNDPSIAGSGLKGMGILGFKLLNLDYFRKLVSQEPMITRNERLQVEWLAQGKYSVGLFIPPEQVVNFMNAGAPVTFIMPKEGTYLANAGAGLMMLTRAPHPNATKVFINWLISKEGMIFLSNLDRSQTSRADIPTDMIFPTMLRKEGIDYFMGGEDREWLLRDPEFVKAARDIFGDLLGR